jgi:hypothetical protein
MQELLHRLLEFLGAYASSSKTDYVLVAVSAVALMLLLNAYLSKRNVQTALAYDPEPAHRYGARVTPAVLVYRRLLMVGGVKPAPSWLIIFPGNYCLTVEGVFLDVFPIDVSALVEAAIAIAVIVPVFIKSCVSVELVVEPRARRPVRTILVVIAKTFSALHTPLNLGRRKISQGRIMCPLQVHKAQAAETRRRDQRLNVITGNTCFHLSPSML